MATEMGKPEAVSGLPGAQETELVIDGPRGQKTRTKCLLYLGEQWVSLKAVGRMLAGAGFDVEVASQEEPRDDDAGE